MNTNLQERVAILTALLPEDPEPNQVVVMPEGQIAGAANVLYLYKDSALLGSASSFTPVGNVAKKGSLTRATTTTPIKRGDILRVEYVQLNFQSVMFVQYFGWMGHDIASKQTLNNKTYRVLHVLPLGKPTANFNLYERVCLEHVEERTPKE